MTPRCDATIMAEHTPGLARACASCLRQPAGDVSAPGLRNLRAADRARAGGWLCALPARPEDTRMSTESPSFAPPSSAVPDLSLDYAMRFWRTPPGVRRAYVDGRFGQVHYRIAAPEKPAAVPLICCHLTPNSGRIYSQFIAEMGKDRIAVALDTPGFGESDLPPAPPAIPDYAAVVGELADHLGFEQFDVMGYHTGSRTCVELAQQRPAQVRRLVLVSAPVYSDEEMQLQRRDLSNPDVWALPPDGASFAAEWAGYVRWADPGAPLGFVQRQIAEGLHAGRTAWWGYDAAFAFRYAEELPKIEQPVLILCPQDDLWEPTLRAREYLRNGRFVELPQWAHGFLDVHTAEAVTLVRGFLDGAGDDRPGATKPKAAPPPPATKPKRAFRKHFFDGPYGAVHYRIARPSTPGATPLVMFHMSPSSGRIFEPMLAELGRDRIALAPDTPGFGESEAPQAPIEIEDFAAVMAKLIDSLGLEQVDVMGYHTGSITCVALALARPDLVRRIVQISCPVFTDEELESFRRHYHAKTLQDDGTHLRDAWVSLQKFYGPSVPREAIERNFAEGLRGGPLAHWGHRAAFNYDLRVHLPKVTQPILVINPNDDLVQQTLRGMPLIRSGRKVDLPDHSHGFMDTIPQEFGRILREFLG